MGDTFPAETPDGVEMVRKDVTADGSAVILTDEDGQMYQPNALGAAVAEADEPTAINAAATPHGGENAAVDTTIRDDNSDEVRAMEQSIEEATGSKTTLTASEAQSQMQSAEPVGEATPEEAAANADSDEAADEPDATPAAEALAAEEGVDLSEVEGSGADGKIVKSDVEAAASSDEA